MSMHDDIRRQLMWSRLIAVVEEQARMLMLTAFSATVREAGDLSAGVFDLRGRMVAQAITGTPGHVNSMAEAVPHFLAEFPLAEMQDGDHFITNDPWIASGHLHDITVVSPVFRAARPIGFFACTCHQVDIGGMGQGPDGRSVFEEGLYIPPMHLARAGTPNGDLLRMIRANVRQPRMVEGDVLSYVTTNEAAGRRLVKMLDEFGEDGLETLADWIFARSKNAMIAEIRRLPRGTYENEFVLDGYDRPVRLRAALTIGDDAITVDYAGSDPASPHGINVVLNYCKAYSAFGVRCVVGPRIPNNAGSLAPIVVKAPEGSIVNVKHPWPVSARHVIGQFLPDVMLGCLAKAIPERIPAEGAACLWGAQLRGGPSVAAGAPAQSNRIGEPFEVMFFNSGGSGGRPFADGMNATAFPSGVRALPAEVVETAAPIVIWKKELRPDSAGAGRYRGGLGQTVEVGTVDGAPFAFFAMFDRVKSKPRGRRGGADGTSGKVETAAGMSFRAMGLQTVPADERLRLSLPGGAGWGDPLERPPARVAADVADGLIAREAAERDYGVVLAADGAVDESATVNLRARRRQA
ncbi:MAG: hydantoinase B/oxoprolinase family protein [Alphaproteobacteria bacterium]